MTEDTVFRYIQNFRIVAIGLAIAGGVSFLSVSVKDGSAIVLMSIVIVFSMIVFYHTILVKKWMTGITDKNIREKEELQCDIKNLKNDVKVKDEIIKDIRNRLQACTISSSQEHIEYVELINKLRIREDDLSETIEKRNKEYNDKIAELECRITQANEDRDALHDFLSEMIEDEEKQIKTIIDELKIEENKCKEVLNSVNPIDKIAILYEDAYKAIFMRDTIGEIKVKDYKILQYKLELLRFLYPEIVEDIDNEEEFKRILDYLDDHRNKAKYWLSDDEYNRIRHDEIALEDLALKRYFTSGRLTKIEIGRNYEMFCAHKLRESGFSVTMNGIENGMKDYGIDLIATKEKTIWIIQCKNWGMGKNISEKIITQTYGAMQYYNNTFNSNGEFIVKAAVISSSVFTGDAIKIADVLGVEKRYWEMGEFPAVKCNVNSRGEKIYHLPFDRDYDRTKIINAGELYTATVKEARQKEFRKAYGRCE